LHACVDYPFPRPAVSGWIYAMLGALYMERISDNRESRLPTHMLKPESSAFIQRK
jgi:hypothetical protein